MSDLGWRPPRCIHGHLILGCPHDDCPTQGAYLDQQHAALAEWHQRGQEAAKHVVRQMLGIEATCPTTDTDRR